MFELRKRDECVYSFEIFKNALLQKVVYRDYAKTVQYLMMYPVQLLVFASPQDRASSTLNSSPCPAGSYRCRDASAAFAKAKSGSEAVLSAA